MKKNMLVVIIGVLFVIAVVAAGSFYMGRKSSKLTKGDDRRTGAPMGMSAATPPTLTDKQNVQLAAGTDTSTTEKTFDITGGNFYFVPNKITVNKGDKVTFVTTNAGGMHDLVIDALNVKTAVIKTGETATVSFTADKAGTFEYYCDIPGHKAKGMVGTLVVQ